MLRCSFTSLQIWNSTHESAPKSIRLRKIVHEFFRCAEIRVLQIFDLLIRIIWWKKHNFNRSQCQRTSSNQNTANISTWNFIANSSMHDAKRIKTKRRQSQSNWINKIMINDRGAVEKPPQTVLYWLIIGWIDLLKWICGYAATQKKKLISVTWALCVHCTRRLRKLYEHRKNCGREFVK